VCLFLPGLVGTEFGLNARHGGPDSRTLVRIAIYLDLIIFYVYIGVVCFEACRQLHGYV
jgi:hypothetical protein